MRSPLALGRNRALCARRPHTLGFASRATGLAWRTPRALSVRSQGIIAARPADRQRALGASDFDATSGFAALSSSTIRWQRRPDRPSRGSSNQWAQMLSVAWLRGRAASNRRRYGRVVGCQPSARVEFFRAKALAPQGSLAAQGPIKSACPSRVQSGEANVATLPNHRPLNGVWPHPGSAAR